MKQEFRDVKVCIITGKTNLINKKVEVIKGTLKHSLCNAIRRTISRIICVLMSSRNFTAVTACCS